MAARWVCDHCGATGRVPEGDASDHSLCDQCGESVPPSAHHFLAE